MKKIKIGLYLPANHPIAQIEKGKRATAIYEILDDWYKREQRLKNIEELLQQINAKLTGSSVQVELTPDQEAIMDQVLMDIMNLGKKGGLS